MSKMTREEKLFKNESNVLEYYTEMLSTETTPEQTREALEALTKKYKALLDQTRFLTWISGRLERKLHRTNRDLNDNNTKLKNTLEELTKVEAGKNAYAIIYSVAIVLFVLEEYFVEPVINMFGDSIGYGIVFKLGIVLLLKVSENVLEKRIIKPRPFVAYRQTVESA